LQKESQKRNFKPEFAVLLKNQGFGGMNGIVKLHCILSDQSLIIYIETYFINK